MTLDNVVQPDQYISPRGDVVDLKKSTQKPSFGKKIGRFLAPVMAAAALYAAPQKANADMIWTWDNNSNPGAVIGNVEIINDNNGAVYDSYTLLLSDLADQIYNANLSLHSTYSSGADLVANGLFSYTISPGPISEVDVGYFDEEQASGDISIQNVGGIPNLDYEPWQATQQNPNRDMQRGTLGINNTFLDLNGNGYDPLTDLRIENNPGQQVNLGYGQDIIGNPYVDSGNAINVVPEPNTIAFLALGGGAIAYVLRRRKQN